MRCRFALFVYVLVSSSVAFAQNATDDTGRDWNKFYLDRAGQYEVSLDDDVKTELQLFEKPLLTYTNPIRGRDQHGAVFAWTRDGRPEFLATIWSFDVAGQQSRRVSHEVHSLASTPMQVECPKLEEAEAKRANALAWILQPIDSDITLPQKAMPKPAVTKLRRLVQMRGIIKQLSAVVIDRNDGTERPLRQLPAPLMRYAGSTEDAEITDGAVFAFVLATDPELLLRIEAIDNSWQIKPIRFTGTEIQVKHGETEIWKCEKIDYKNQSGPYRLRVGLTEL